MASWKDKASSSGGSEFGLKTTNQSTVTPFTSLQRVTAIALLVVFVGTLSVFAVTSVPTSADHPNLFGGSLVLEDYEPLVVVDLATGLGTIRLVDVYSSVGASTYDQVQAVPLSDGTMLVNKATGQFNFLGLDDYLADTKSGVGLGQFAGTSAQGFEDGASTYIIRYGASSSSISLVDEQTVTLASQGAASSSAGVTVHPEGFASVGQQIPTVPGATTTANGDLWSLEGSGDSTELDEYTPGSKASARLAESSKGAASSVSAIGSAPISPQGTGRQAVVLAQGGSLEVFDSSGNPLKLVIPGSLDPDTILPVTSCAGQMWFLYHQSDGWRSVGVDLESDKLLGPEVLHAPGLAIPGDLATPAFNMGHIYTLDTAAVGTSAMLEIDPDSGLVETTKGISDYPQKTSAEQAPFTDTEVMSVGPRLVFNNPEADEAVVFFTDGSRPPAIVDKSNLPTIDPSAPPGAVTSKAAGGSTPTTSANRSSEQPPTPTTVPSAPALAQVDTQLNCATSEQTPHAPLLSPATAGPRSASLSWTYPLLDSQDCEPTSYLVDVSGIDGASSPPGYPVEVNDVLDYSVTGLHPAMTYQATISALIGSNETVSQPVQFTTTAAGPGAPIGVHTVFDPKQQGWVVSWSPCTGADCDVAPAQWTVVGSPCGSDPFLGTSPSLPGIDASTTSVLVPITGSLAGAGLTFAVTGTSDQDLNGDPGSDGQCTVGWQAPDPADIALNGGASVQPNGTVSANLGISLIGGASSVQAFGSFDTQFTYELTDSTTGAQPLLKGPTSAESVTFANLQPNDVYSASVNVAPQEDPADSVIIGHEGNIQQPIPWPNLIAPTPTLTLTDQNDAVVDPGSVNLAPGAPPATPGGLASEFSPQMVCDDGNDEQTLEQNGDYDLSLITTDPAGCEITYTFQGTIPSVYGNEKPPTFNQIAVPTRGIPQPQVPRLSVAVDTDNGQAGNPYANASPEVTDGGYPQSQAGLLTVTFASPYLDSLELSGRGDSYSALDEAQINSAISGSASCASDTEPSVELPASAPVQSTTLADCLDLVLDTPITAPSTAYVSVAQSITATWEWLGATTSNVSITPSTVADGPVADPSVAPPATTTTTIPTTTTTTAVSTTTTTVATTVTG